MSVQKMFFKTSPHGHTGSSVNFHAIGGAGYTTNISKAETYTLEEAQNAVNKGWLRQCNEQELFLSCQHVIDLAEHRVDCQLIDHYYPENLDSKDLYLGIKTNRFDGNDVLFYSKQGGFTFSVAKAEVINFRDIPTFCREGTLKYIPLSHADEIKRLTFQARNINRRKMISGAGLIGIRKPRKSRSSGKTRWNCPACGKINWQYNPYDFEGCHDSNCEKRFN